MSMQSRGERVFDDGRTKQSFKDSTDINKILKKAQISGGLSHALKYDKAVYGEFENYDLLEAYTMLNKAQRIFNELPSEVRDEFGNDAIKFAGFASDPANIDRLPELLPAIAEPGSYFPNPIRRDGQEPKAPKAAVPPKGSGATDTDSPAAIEPASAPEGAESSSST